MRYLLKQKLLSFGDDFFIRDEAGNDVFYVDGKVFTLGDQLSFQNLAGQELAHIRQRLLSWGPTYEISRNGAVLAVVKKTLFTFFRCEFTVDVPGPDDLLAFGSCTSSSLHVSSPASRRTDCPARLPATAGAAATLRSGAAR